MNESGRKETREALERIWDETWDFISENKRPSLEQAADLEHRFQNLLDRVDRRYDLEVGAA